MKSRIDYRIRISYIMEKAAATLGSIGLMIVITEQYVLPTIQPILPSQTVGMTFIQKLGELGWVLLDMIFPYISLSIRLLSFVLFICHPGSRLLRVCLGGRRVVYGTATHFNVCVEADDRFITLYLLAFYAIFECVLNAFAEVTRFADRGFYDAWWNSTTWDQVRHPKAITLSPHPSLSH